MSIEKEGALDNLCDYQDLAKIKFMISNLSKFESLAKSGNQTAHCIFIDLTLAMNHTNLTQKQKAIIKMKYVEGFNNCEIAEKLNVSETAIRKHINGGIKRMIKLLGAEK